MNRSRRYLRTQIVTLFPPVWLVLTYLAFPISFEAVAWWVRAIDIDWSDVAGRELARRLLYPRDLLLGIGLGYYGIYRVLAHHPWYHPLYADWLRLTPWRAGKPLPLGPVQLVPQDALVVLAAWLWSLDSSALWFGDFVAMLVVPFLVAQLLPLWLTDARGRVLLVLIGLAMLALLRTTAPAGLAVLAVCYGVVRFGLPWSVQKSVEGANCAASTLASIFGQTEDRARSRPPALGFPYALLSPTPPSAIGSDYEGICVRDAVGIAVTLSAWLFALASYAPPETRGSTSYFAATAGLLITIMGRTIIYVAPFQPPLSFLGRMVNRKWFLPNYDRVFLPAVCAGAPLLGLWLVRWYVPDQLFWTAPLALGAGWIITLAAPPTLRNWALTGSHRITTAALSRVDYIEV